ncbi:MAG: hypothetical protein AB8C46_14830 [Burkholderiaceae bacterium]
MKHIPTPLLIALIALQIGAASSLLAAEPPQSKGQSRWVDLSTSGRGILTAKQYSGGIAHQLSQRWVRHTKIKPEEYERRVRAGQTALYTVEPGSEEVMQKPFPNGKLYGRTIQTSNGERAFSMVVICESRNRSRFFELWGERNFILGEDSTPIVDFVTAAGKGCGNRLNKRASKLPASSAPSTNRLAAFLAPSPWQEINSSAPARYSDAPARHFKLDDLYDVTIEKAVGPDGRTLTKWAFNWLEVHMNRGDIADRSLMFWERENSQLYGMTIVTLAEGQKARMFWLWSKNPAERLVMTVIPHRKPNKQERQYVLNLLGRFPP